VGRPKGSKNKKKVNSEIHVTEDKTKVQGRFDKVNDKVILYCFKEDNWKNLEVCNAFCSASKKNKCSSYRLLQGNPIRVRKTKREMDIERDIEKDCEGTKGQDRENYIIETGGRRII